MDFNFEGVEAAKGGSFTQPGTIGVFNISKVEFGTSKEKQTPFMRLVFDCQKIKNEEGILIDESSSFPHEFYMTTAALKRVQYLSVVMFDEELTGEVTDKNLIAKFLDKQIALKVTGKVSDKGKGYADLPWAGFAKKASEFINDTSILNFSAQERASVEEALEAIKNSSSAKADSESAPVPTAEGTAPKKAF